LLFGNTFGETTFVPNDELAPHGEDDVVPRTALPLGPNFLFFPALPAPPVSFFSETILERSRAKSAIVSENKRKSNEVSHCIRKQKKNAS
jgi:hypothetical protein